MIDGFVKVKRAERTSVQKTYYPKPGDFERHWYVVDAADETLGRLASRIAEALIGKRKPKYTPGVDMGDFVVVVNAEKIAVTGKKLDEKFYYRYSGYPSGMKKLSLRQQLAKAPEHVIKAAVWGMLPHNRLGRKMLKHLKVYAGPDHPHQAQQPEPLI
jgi:large subunit ribosomal protein L13